MKPEGLDKEFIIIGENVHTTRILLRKGKLVTTDPDGVESVRFYDSNRKRRYLTIPADVKRSQDYEEGRVKHVKIAIQAAMGGGPEAATGMDYLRRLVERQVAARTDFLDLNVDEISLKLEDQKTAMQWLVRTVQDMCSIPLSVDSSNIEIIAAGLEAAAGNGRRNMLNSASLERLEALDLAHRYDSRVIVTAAGAAGMPQNDDERVDNATRMVEAALGKGIALADIYVDPLIFPISVDGENGNYSFEAMRRLRADFGPEIHISGGFSNVSFGLPCRRLVNDVFMNLAVEAGADSGIVDPVTSGLDEVFRMDRGSRSYELAADLLLGRDQYCRNFLRAYRKGELQ